MDSLLILKGYEVRKEWSPTLIACVILRGLYCVDSLWYEDTFSSTFEAQSEGLGLMNVQVSSSKSGIYYVATINL